MNTRTSVAVGMAIFLSLASASAQAKDMTIIESAQPRATIVIAAQAGENVKAAADDLRDYLQKISGAKLPLVTDERDPQGPAILVGPSRLTTDMKIAIPSGVTPQRVEEGFVIVCRGDRLVLAGNNDGPYHGTEYAVYEFLNRLGVRWYMPGEFGEFVPRQPTVSVSEIDHTEKPDFIIRCWGYVGGCNGTPEMEAQTKRWKVRNKLNDTGLEGIFAIPTDGNVLPAEMLKTQPELFGLKTDGTRTEAMPNLSNPKAVEAAAKIAKDYLRTHPAVNSFPVGVHDGMHRDATPETAARSMNIREMYSRPGIPEELTCTDEWIAFVNQIAEQVVKEFPYAYITTTGYATRHVPPIATKPHERVAVMYAPIFCCNLHALNDPHCWQNVRQAQILKRWTELCPQRVWMYNYLEQMLVTGLTPVPETRKLRTNFPLYKKWGVIGFHDEARNIWAEPGVASRYLRARLEWNADADVDAILNDFYQKWYGAAAGPSRAFYDAIEDAIAKAPVHGHEDRILPMVYTSELMRTLEQRIGEAEKAADTDRSKLHVQIDRLIYEHLKDYVALTAAEDAGDWAGAVRLSEHTMELRKQAHAINPFFFWPDEKDFNSGIFDWGATYRRDYYQQLVDKTSGKTGDLVALLPQQPMTRADVQDDGLFEAWHQPNLNEAGWEPILTTRPYYFQGHTDAQGHPYDGYVWYRFSVDVPTSAKGKKVMVYAPVLECEAWGWCNGQFVGHRKYAESWLRPNPMEMDVTDAIKPGERNQITFRVSTGFCRAADGGGFQSRLMLYAPKEQPKVSAAGK